MYDFQLDGVREQIAPRRIQIGHAGDLVDAMFLLEFINRLVIGEALEVFVFYSVYSDTLLVVLRCGFTDARPHGFFEAHVFSCIAVFDAGYFASTVVRTATHTICLNYFCHFKLLG